MPKSPFFRRKPSAHGPSSLLRFLFPRTRARAREHLHTFRHETLSRLRHRAQARIYRYIVARQARKLKGKPGILQRLRGQTRRLAGTSYLENEARRRRREIAKGSTMSYQDNYEPRESGGRRRKLAGYLKAANELRQTYTAQYAPNWKNEQNYRFEDDTPGEFPDAAVVRSGEEELILFPSYARKHIKRKPEVEPGTIQEVEGEGRDARDSTGAGDAEFWKKQWENYEDDNAVVDVDVRGWIYSPFKGQMSRKQRLFIGLARQLVGIQAPPAGSNENTSTSSSRDPSPGHGGHREGHQARQAQRDEMAASREAEEILRRGEKEAAVAAKGGYSEKPARGNSDDTQLYRTQSRDSIRTLGSGRPGQLSHTASRNSLREDEHITPLQKRASWNQPADMSPNELAEANARLMARLRHFLAVPMANTPISIFFYNDKISKQRTVYTDASGHFSVSAALDFVPTNVRILASDQLSATEEVIVTDSKGISVISDIDDTIKHSAISSGPREIFRNAFIRELGDLTIAGVRDWYNAMADQGVKFHYVSNSPWQLFPVISKYFELAGLPPGSFHLKQYSGMLQGIFEPVAERKKVTLDKIARDFPERRFILIGDSGEADLEVYTDFVLENPGRVVAVFIRDVTTTENSGFFDPSVGPVSGGRSRSSSPEYRNGMQAHDIKRIRPTSEEHDPELKAAIAASLRQMDEDELKRSKSLFPQIDADHPDMRPRLPDRKPSSTHSTRSMKQDTVHDLIDLSDEPENQPALRRANTDTKFETDSQRTSPVSSMKGKSAPPPPRKPQGLRSPSSDALSTPQSPSSPKPPAPPKPRRLSNTVTQPSPLSQATSASRTPASSTSKPAIASKPDFTRTDTAGSQQTYAGMAKDKLWSVYNQLPALRSQDGNSAGGYQPEQNGTRKQPPPPPPPRRRDAPANAASYVATKASNAWQAAPSIPYHSRPQITTSSPSPTQASFSTSSPQQRINRTGTGSTLGVNGNADAQIINKREQLWRQRWQKAEEILRSKGVVLRSWRVGEDVRGEAERVVKEALRRGK